MLLHGMWCSFQWVSLFLSNTLSERSFLGGTNITRTILAIAPSPRNATRCLDPRPNPPSTANEHFLCSLAAASLGMTRRTLAQDHLLLTASAPRAFVFVSLLSHRCFIQRTGNPDDRRRERDRRQQLQFSTQVSSRQSVPGHHVGRDRRWDRWHLSSHFCPRRRQQLLGDICHETAVLLLS